MQKRDIYERAFKFAARVLKMNDALKRDSRVNRNTLSQLVDASSSVGANLEEARVGHSAADFNARLRVSLKEARESYYWLRLLRDTGEVSPRRIEPLISEANEIVAILMTIVRKVNPNPPATPNS
jgi:four helix bundle protein